MINFSINLERFYLQRTFFIYKKHVKNQGSIIKQHAIEFIEHTHTFNHIINIKITHNVLFNERISTLQK